MNLSRLRLLNYLSWARSRANVWKADRCQERLKCQVQVQLKITGVSKVRGSKAKWNKWVSCNLIYSLCPWRQRRVKDYSRVQSDGATEPERLFFLSVVIKVPHPPTPPRVDDTSSFSIWRSRLLLFPSHTLKPQCLPFLLTWSGFKL